MATTIDGNVTILGSLTVTDGYQGFERDNLDVASLDVHPIPLMSLRVHDAMQTNLPGTGASDDLALISGTIGTASPTIQTGDLKAAGATTRYARFQFPLPPEYIAGEQVRLRFHAGMTTTTADVTATLDVEAYPIDRDGTVSADVCSTAATSINNTTFANKDFILDPTNLTPGMMLDVRIAIAINDGATATAVIGTIGEIALLCDRKG